MPYVDLDTLKNADGLVAIISQRTSNGMLTFAIFKEFDRDGAVERTSFISANLTQSYLDMVKLTLERVQEIHADPKLLAQLRAAAGVESVPHRGKR